MSLQAITWAFNVELSDELGPSAKLVLLALANYADEDGESYPSQQTLARMTSQSIDSVQRRLKDLTDAGFLSVRHRRRKSNIYKILGLEPQSAAIKAPVAVHGDTHGSSKEPQNGSLGTALLRQRTQDSEPKNLIYNRKGLFGQSEQQKTLKLTDSQFDQFWKEYPPGRKTEKKSVRAKLEKLVASGEVSFDCIMAGVRRYVDYRPDPQYTKAPLVWLNRGCWDDELKRLPPARQPVSARL